MGKKNIICLLFCFNIFFCALAEQYLLAPISNIKRIIPGLNIKLTDDFYVEKKQQTLGDRESGKTFKVGTNGVIQIIEQNVYTFITWKDAKNKLHTDVYFKDEPLTAYPIIKRKREKPVKAVLLDLDGTCVNSEPLWIEILLRVTRKMIVKKIDEFKTLSTIDGNNKIIDLNNNLKILENGFPERDHSYIAGFTVEEHLNYLRTKYFPFETSTVNARKYYNDMTNSRNLKEQEDKSTEFYQIIDYLLQKGIKPYAPKPGMALFINTLLKKGIKVGIVTSGLFYKAWPELKTTFDAENIDINNPNLYYITAGIKPEAGHPNGTIGDISAKPKPGIVKDIFGSIQQDFARENISIDMDNVDYLGDSHTDTFSGLTAGVPVTGMKGGTIEIGHFESFCNKMMEDFYEYFSYLFPGKTLLNDENQTNDILKNDSCYSNGNNRITKLAA